MDAFNLLLQDIASSFQDLMNDWHVSHLPFDRLPRDFTVFWESMLIGLPSPAPFPLPSDTEFLRASSPKYVILMNASYGALAASSVCPRGYRVYSLISFEELGKAADSDRILSHFTCVAFSADNTKYFLYDDLLSLRPGGWQGGVVDKKRSPHWFDLNVAHFLERVPICIFKRIDQKKQPPKERGAKRLKSTGPHASKRKDRENPLPKLKSTEQEGKRKRR